MVEAGAEAEIETVAGAEVAACIWTGAMGKGEGETVVAVKTGGGGAVETATATIAGLDAEIAAGAEAEAGAKFEARAESEFEARAETETEVGAGTGAKAEVEAEVATGTNVSTGTGVVVARPSRAMLIVSASPLVPTCACAPTPSSAQPARRARVEKRGIAVSFLYRLPAAHPDNNPSRADWERGGSNFRNMGEDHVRSARIPKNPIISSNLNTKNPAGTTRRDSRIIG